MIRHEFSWTIGGAAIATGPADNHDGHTQAGCRVCCENNMQVVIGPIDPVERPRGYLTSVTQGFEIVRTISSQDVKVLYDFYHETRWRKPHGEAGTEH